MALCLKTEAEIGSATWQSQAACRCANCEARFLEKQSAARCSVHNAAIRSALQVAIQAQRTELNGMRRVLAAQVRSGRGPSKREAEAIATAAGKIAEWEAALDALRGH